MQYFDLNTCRELEKRGLKGERALITEDDIVTKYSLLDLFDPDNARLLWGKDWLGIEGKSPISYEYHSHQLLTLYQSEGFEAVEKYLREYLKIEGHG